MQDSKNIIQIKSYENNDTQIKVSIQVNGKADFLRMFYARNFFYSLTYGGKDVKVPMSLGIIPALSVLLPVSWFFDAEIKCECLDDSFYECISDVKNGYQNMYPYIQFKGNIMPERTENNDISCSSGKALVMFSGGVDAFNTLSSHYEEGPDLLTIWGADVAEDNEKGWSPVEKQLSTISKEFGLKYFYVRSNCRNVLNEKELNSYIKTYNTKLNWWHDFQHGICIISHAAPLAYENNYSAVYIASTFTANDIGHYTCASDPTIDNMVRFGNTKVIHDGYEYSRQDKIHNICNFRGKTQKNIPLRVCYESKIGDNCCRCEKCYRTIMGILAEKENPVSLGFSNFDEKHRKKMLRDIRAYRIPNYNFRYQYIQNRLHENYSREDCPNDLLWFYDVKIDSNSNNTSFKKIWRIKRKIMRGFTKIFGIRW